MFRVPTRILLQPGALGRLPEVVTSVAARRPLLVFDAGLAATPWSDHTAALLRGASEGVLTFDGVEPNPRDTTVDAITRLARAERVDLVIGLGGGSVLDAAKAAAMLAANAGSIRDYEGRNRFDRPPLPFIAIPTTCGTGSEVTWVSVITHTEARRKISVKGDGMFPTYALVDADLLTSLPPALVAATGMDALTHAVEAYTCRAANPVSDALAEKAVALLLKHLPAAAREIATNAVAREAVMRAATLAGLAFGNADVAAVHCLSESIGGLLDVPHGVCNAALLVPTFRYQFDAVQERLALLAHATGLADAPTATDAAHALLRIFEDLHRTLALPTFTVLGVPASLHPAIASLAVQNNSNGSNARPLDAADYARILATA